MIYDKRPCELGEGALWHPERRQLFWFDILGKKLHTIDRDGSQTFSFVEMVSAAGWVTRDHLLIAGERDLFLFEIESEEIETIAELEAGNPKTRSNDGRADRQGGFWIGTMGKRGGADPGMGAIYRWSRGELRKLFDGCGGQHLERAMGRGAGGLLFAERPVPERRALRCAPHLLPRLRRR